MGWWGRNRTKLQHVAERRKSPGSEGEIFKWNVISTRNETKLTLAHKSNHPKQKKKHPTGTSGWRCHLSAAQIKFARKVTNNTKEARIEKQTSPSQRERSKIKCYFCNLPSQ